MSFLIIKNQIPNPKSVSLEFGILVLEFLVLTF